MYDNNIKEVYPALEKSFQVSQKEIGEEMLGLYVFDELETTKKEMEQKIEICD